MARDGLAGDTLVYPGGAVKALGDDGTFEGLLIPFGSPDAADLTSYRDFFTPETELGFDPGEAHKCVLLYNHGLDPDLGLTPLGTAELKMTDAGVWMKGQIRLRDAYLKKYGAHAEQLRAAAKAGSLGLSSGALYHSMKRTPQPNGSNRVDCWFVGEASLTPTPADPRATTHAIKSLADAIKGEFLGGTAEAEVALAAVERAFELCRRRIGGHLGAGYWGDGPAEGRTPKPRAERIAAIGGCLDEHRAMVMRAVEALTPEGADGGEGAATKSQPDLIDTLLSRLR